MGETSQYTAARAPLSLFDRWKRFLDIVADPWTLVSLIATVYFASEVVTSPEGARAVLTVILTLTSAVLGNILAMRWNEQLGKDSMIARGQVAVRQLGLLLFGVYEIQDRVRQLELDESQSEELAQTYLGEVDSRCRLLVQQSLVAIDNWRDLVPEADVTQELRERAKLKRKIFELREEIARSKKELVEAQSAAESSESTMTELKDELDEKEALLKDLTWRSFEKNLTGVVGQPSTYRIYAGDHASEALLGTDELLRLIGMPACPNCGEFVPDKKECAKCGEILPEKPLEST